MTAPSLSHPHISRTATAEKEARAPCEGWLPSPPPRSATTGPSAAPGRVPALLACACACVWSTATPACVAFVY